MLRKLKPKSEFSRNVLTLMTGTSIAQAIPIAISPILTRIYSPEDFGMFALYVSIVSIISIVVTGKYDLAIMMPSNNEDAINIVAISILLTFIISSIFLIVILVFNESIAEILGNKQIAGWLYLTPVSIFCTGIYQSLNYWSNRKKEYKRLAIIRVVQSGTATTSNIGFGASGFTSGGLIVGNFLGQFLSTTVLFKLIYNKDYEKLKIIQISTMRKMAKQYMSFPQYIMISELVTVLLFQLPILFLSMFFNASMVGFYNLVQRMLGMPMTLLSRSVSDVFKEKASSDYNKNGHCEDVYKNTFKLLLILGILPFLILFFYAPSIFSFLFGDKWIVAGEFAQILSIMFLLKFISSPLSYMFYIVNEQKKDLFYHLYLLVSSILIFYIFDDVKIILIIYSINYSLIYIQYIRLSYKYAKGKICHLK